MYHIYIDGAELPVPPGKLEIKVGNRNKTVNLIDEGEINLLRSPGLTDIAFDALLPNARYHFAAGSGTLPSWHSKLESLKKRRKSFRLIIAREDGGMDTNLRVSLEEYSLKEDAERYGRDALASLKLRQYRPYGTKTVVIQSTGTVNSAEAGAGEDAPEAPISHTVVAGDTLWALCKKYLGDGSKYPEVAKKNGIPNPNLIYPGQVIYF